MDFPSDKFDLGGDFWEKKTWKHQFVLASCHYV